MNDEITKDDVSNWATVANYVATYPDGDRDGAADVDVQIGASEGLWFVRTTDDAGGDDDADAVFARLTDLIRVSGLLTEGFISHI
jgi:hypothetical protein